MISQVIKLVRKYEAFLRKIGVDILQWPRKTHAHFRNGTSLIPLLLCRGETLCELLSGLFIKEPRLLTSAAVCISVYDMWNYLKNDNYTLYDNESPSPLRSMSISIKFYFNFEPLCCTGEAIFKKFKCCRNHASEMATTRTLQSTTNKSYTSYNGVLFNFTIWF